VLLGHMDVSEMPLQRITSVDRVSTPRMKQQSDCAGGLMNAMCDREAGLSDVQCRVYCVCACSIPNTADSIYDVGAGSIDDCLGFSDARLNEWTVPKQGSRST
jgi:hypothetical protein